MNQADSMKWQYKGGENKMNEKVVTRPLEMRDAEQIKQIDAEGDFEIYDFIEDMLEEGAQDYAYGVFLGDVLVGYCTIGGADEIEEAECDDELLGDVYVKEEYRSKGYAHKLVEYALSEHSEHSIYADILYDELEAFYADFGFVRKELGLLILKRG